MIQFTKQPSENLDYDFDFNESFPSGDNISSAMVIVLPSGVTLGTKQLSGQSVKQWVSGGTAGANHKITCVATSVSGRIKEMEFKLSIIDN